MTVTLLSYITPNGISKVTRKGPSFYHEYTANTGTIVREQITQKQALHIMDPDRVAWMASDE